MTPQTPADTFAYDVFIVHAAGDEAFVQGYLLPALDLPSDRVLVPRTLELGRFIVAEIERGVRSSRVTLVVLSPACLADDWAVFGQQIAAYASVASDIHGVLLPLLLADCDLPAHIRALVTLDFQHPAREGWEAEVGRLRAYLARPAAPAQDLLCPYPGMRPFTEQDAGRFFGRDVEIARIVHRLQRGEREIYVIGASGSGKSSLVAAGLVPRLTRGVEGLPRFHVQRLRPGERPIERLAAALSGELTDPATAVGALLASHAPAASLLLVVDQLEELFAIAPDDQRRGFLTAIRALRAYPRCVLVFTLRADFYGAFLNSPLWTDRQGAILRIELGPLPSHGVRLAIERPARDVGVYFQAELLSRLLDDADREPGALPLLQETLLQLWGKRRQRLLALADYHAMADGSQTGLAFAVKEHADAVLDALPDAQKPIALRILLRLVTFGEGRADTRRQQVRDGLRSDGEAEADFDAVLRRLVDNRLVTVTGDDLPATFASTSHTRS
ncbi:MAG TPA: TIR domain-containing protein [Kofleriaceae bacterium]